jgi:transposase
MHTKNDRVTQGTRRRRDHSPELKRELVARSLIPGASVSAIALEAGINANLLFTWRRAHLKAESPSQQAAQSSPAVLMPVTLEAPTHAPLPAPPPAAPRSNSGTIDIEIGGARVRLRGSVDEASVRNVLRALRERA